MTKSRRKQQPPAAPRVVPDAASPRAPGRLVEIDVLAGLGVFLCLARGWATRNNLNPDGVSYLDLARVLEAGDWGAFVQGYWSPLYPALLALLGAVSTMERTAFLPLVHMLNAVIAIGGIACVWHWGHRRRDVVFARVAMVAFVLAAAQPLRIEAVTPDMLLLVLAAWIGYEMIERRGERPVRLGVLLGLAYLGKTSAWPWLVVVLALLAIRHWRERRQLLLRVAAAAALVMAPWVAVMSADAGRFTMSSAGGLNLCWYLRSCDGRTPDTHQGAHEAYGMAPLTTGAIVTVAQVGTGNEWTYAPWSDPGAWAARLVDQDVNDPSLRELVVYWAKQAYFSVTLWMSRVLLVLGALAVASWPPASRRRAASREPLFVSLLGALGIGQFIAVHSEPRLIAPFFLLVALGIITWLRDAAVPDHEVSRTWRMARHVVSLAAVVFAIALAGNRIKGELSASARVDQTWLAIDAQFRAAHPGDGPRRIAVVGYAIPALSDVWRAGARIVTQVPPHSAVTIGQLPADQQVAELRRLIGTTADAAWLINPDGRFQWLPIEP